MKLRNFYKNIKCPHCDKETITYWQKISLIDYRYTYTCKECGGTIQLPLWHTAVYLGEIIMLIVGIVRLNMSSWQAILSGVLVLIFINFVQLLFIPIKG